MTVADVDSLKARMGTTSTTDDALLAEVITAAVLWVDERVYPDAVDADDVVEAKLLAAMRLYRARNTPEGVAGFGGDGVVVRIMSTDPRIASLLERHLDTSRLGVG
jgi:hypothetical protein